MASGSGERGSHDSAAGGDASGGDHRRAGHLVHVQQDPRGDHGPFNILAVRFLIAAGLLIVLFHRRLLKLDRRTLGCGAAMGGVFFASMALEMHALTGASSSTVSFLENTAIVLVPMAAALMARRRPAAPWLRPAPWP